MPQNLIRLPKIADIRFTGRDVTIRNHKVVERGGLTSRIMRITNDQGSNRQTLVEFEKHGINSEMAIEECVRELEEDVNTLAHAVFMYWDREDILKYYTGKKWDDGIFAFTKNKTGRIIADQYIEKIRSCDNWGDLYDELHHTSKFQKYMKKRIKEEMRQQCRKV